MCVCVCVCVRAINEKHKEYANGNNLSENYLISRLKQVLCLPIPE